MACFTRKLYAAAKDKTETTNLVVDNLSILQFSVSITHVYLMAICFHSKTSCVLL